MASYELAGRDRVAGVIPARNSGHVCTTCGRRFNRSDSMRRHRRTHESGHQHNKTRRRACLACVRCKTKCSESRPTCERCAVKGLPCLYVTEKRRSLSNDNDATFLSSGRYADGAEESLEGTIEGAVALNNGSAAAAMLGSCSNGGTINIPGDRCVPAFAAGDRSSEADGEQQVGSGLALEILMPQQLPSWPQAALGQFIGVGDFYPTLHSPSVTDWCSDDNFSNILLACLGGNSPTESPVFVPSPGNTPQQAGDKAMGLQDPAEDANHDHDTADATHLCPMVRPLHEGQHQVDTETAQNEVEAEAGNYLPSLVGGPGPGPGPTQFALPSVDNATRDNLRDSLRLPLLHIPWRPLSLTPFPSGEQLDYLIDLYFSHFDQLLPMIHRPSFDPGAHPVLTLSMCAIGVSYSDFGNAEAFRKSLCELLRRLLLFISEQSPTASRSYEYLAAHTLQSVLGNSSGQRLFEFGDNNRGLIVANARAMGLFALRRRDQQLLGYHQGGGISLKMRWESWIRAERLRRLAWCIYVFDASATYYRNCRPHLSLAEMEVDLPCSTGHWEAETAHAWARLHPWTNGVPPHNASFREMVGSVFENDECCAVSANGDVAAAAGPGLAKITDEFHRLLMATTLLRMTWDHRDSLRGPGPLASSTSDSLPDKTNMVLSALSGLTTTALREAAENAQCIEFADGRELPWPGSRFGESHEEREFQGLVHRARIFLVAQIIAADHIGDFMRLDADWRRRGAGAEAGAGRDQFAIEIAERRLRAWADADPVQPRRMARIGAQLLAMSRLYPYNMPREPYDAFRAGLLLWTMVPLIRSSTAPAAAGVSEEWEDAAPSDLHDISSLHLSRRDKRRVCHLDWLGREDKEEAHTVRDWIAHGGDGFVLRIHGIADICTDRGSRQVLQSTSDVLRRLQVWGASKAYRDIVLRALREGD